MVHEFASAQDIGVLSLQEIDVNAESACGYRAEWRRLGYQVVLSELETDTQRHRVALVSKMPCRPVQLCDLDNPQRVAAGLVEVEDGHQFAHVLVIAIYGYPCDQEATDALFLQVQQAMLRFGGLSVLCGDFNAVQEDGAVGAALQRGTWHSLDEFAPHLMLPTNPTRSRRIDFALSHRRIWATELHHYDTALSDHRLVAYTLNIVARSSCFAPPQFARLTREDPDEVASRFAATWQADAFACLIQCGDVDSAWTQLSDAAEEALADGHRVVNRSDVWRPRCKDATSVAPSVHGHESQTLRVVRKLHNQLGQLCAQSHDHPLRRNVGVSLRNLRHLLPETPYFCLDCPEAAFQWCDQLHRELQAQEKQAALARWRQRLKEDSVAAAAWVKRKAAEFLQGAGAQVLPPEECQTVHPAAFVAREAGTWAAKWSTAGHELDYEAVEAALRVLPDLSSKTPVSLQLDADMLQKAAGTMTKKASGADNWSAEALLRLPRQWWQALTDLWNCILRVGRVPQLWKRIVITLIPKKSEESRPIGLCPVVWRLGAKAVNKLLRPWLESWIDESTLGAAPGRGTADAHGRLLLARKSGVRHFIKQDLSSFFDTIDLEAMSRLLRRLGAPPQLGLVLRSFYSSQVRLFKSQSFYASEWVTVSRGIVQGCPLSPTIALAFGRLWSAYCKTPCTSNLIYIDDRAIWPKPGTPNIAAGLDRALDLCNAFDRTFGFKCRAKKCAAVQPPGDSLLNDLASRREYPVENALEMLGVILSLEGAADRPLKLDLKVLSARLHYLRLCSATLRTKQTVYRSLVASALVWAAGVASPDDSTLEAMRKDIKATLSPALAKDTPWVLLCAAHGWLWEPQWHLDHAALCTALRLAARPPLWLDDASFTWQDLAPRAEQVVQRLGWTIGPRGETIARVDDYGTTRTYRFGFDHPRVLQQWLQQEFQLWAVHQCGRVKKSFHRAQPGTATGLALPAPAPGTRFALLGHKCLTQDDSLERRRAALASGGSCWYAVARQGRKEVQHTTCMCGGDCPSRPHVTWQCPRTAHVRAGLTMPTDRAQERLFAAHLKEIPAPPGAGSHEHVIRKLQGHLADGLAASAELACATDGSSSDDVGACAVVSENFAVAASDDREDQTPFKYEMLALWLLFAALSRVSPLGELGRLYVLVDCQAALQALQRPSDCCLNALAVDIVRMQSDVRRHGLRVTLHWVPSHGKHVTWCSPNRLSVGLCRDLNDKADREANRCRSRRAQGSARARWHQERLAALQWETKVICAAAEASSLLQQHVAATMPAARAAVEAPGEDV